MRCSTAAKGSAAQAKGSVLNIVHSLTRYHVELSVAVVARKLRIQYEGAIYHVMNRGDRREDIFHSDSDRQLFLETLGQACDKTGWQIHAWCLMRNHLLITWSADKMPVQSFRP